MAEDWLLEMAKARSAEKARQRTLELVRETPGGEPCQYAAGFLAVCKKNVLDARITPALEMAPETGVININQAKVILLDTFMDWLATVPVEHLETARDHRCLWTAFYELYGQIKSAELVVSPPAVAHPKPPPPQPQRKSDERPTALEIGDIIHS